MHRTIEIGHFFEKCISIDPNEPHWNQMNTSIIVKGSEICNECQGKETINLGGVEYRRFFWDVFMEMVCHTPSPIDTDSNLLNIVIDNHSSSILIYVSKLYNKIYLYKFNYMT